MTPTPSALERCAGEVEGFRSEFWARAPLHRPGADPAAFSDLFSLADVDFLVSSASLRTPAFRLVKDGTSLPPSSYTRSGRMGSRPLSDLADAGRIYELFEGGATIVLQSLHRYWPPLTRFCRDLELTLTHPVQVNVYVTPPAARGLGVHHDGHDVFVLQVYGRKRWDVYVTGDEAGQGRQLVATELNPGDALYIPKTFPHAARTTATASVHLTVGVLTTTWRDVVRRSVERILEDPAYAEPLPMGYAGDSEALTAHLSERLGDLGRRLDKLDTRPTAEAVAQRFWSSRPPILTDQIAQLLGLDQLHDRSVVRVRPGSVVRLRTQGEMLVLQLGDRQLHMPLRLEPVMRRIAEQRRFALADLAGDLDEQSRLVLVRRLVREGLLEVAVG